MKFPERAFIAVLMLLQPLAWAVSEHTLDSMRQCEPPMFILAGVVWFACRALKLLFCGFEW